MFSKGADDDVSPVRYLDYPELNDIISVTKELGGDVVSGSTQQKGVEVSVLTSSSNSTSESDFFAAYSVPVEFSLETPVSSFEASINSNGANGVFAFNSTALNGTAGRYSLLKCFETNGTTKGFGRYALSADPDTEGTWWIEDEDNNYISADTILTYGAKYYINFVVKDNGDYDEDRTLGEIKDPVALGTSDSGTGCTLNPTAGFSLEWAILGIGVLLSILRSRLYKR
ncbi:hypothetical protein D0S45_03755 [Marinifilum sp. JC120]|nr:hypothetical protein D0S45_03755 [Marinifilum sp. JC120]